MDVRVEDFLPSHPFAAPFIPLGLDLGKLFGGDERRTRAQSFEVRFYFRRLSCAKSLNRV